MKEAAEDSRRERDGKAAKKTNKRYTIKLSTTRSRWSFLYWRNRVPVQNILLCFPT